MATEAKPQGTGEEDLSMEEILQSIRRIIAEDGEEGKDAANGAVTGSDVFELTEKLPDEPAAASAAAPSDVLGAIDEALAKPPEPAPPAPPVAEKPTQVQDPTPVPKASEPPAASPQDVIDSLLSAQAAAATAAAFKKIPVPEEPAPFKSTLSPQFRSGMTVEDMVEEMLRPMMKEWLDANLPGIVERIVEREVKRLAR